MLEHRLKMTVQPAARVLLSILFLGQLFQAAVAVPSFDPVRQTPAPPSFAAERGIDQSLVQLQKSSPQDGTTLSSLHFTLLPLQHRPTAPCTELEPYRLPGFSPLAYHLIDRQQTSSDL